MLQNDSEIDTRNTASATNWAYDFGYQPTSDGQGNPYTYEVRINAVAGYIHNINGLNITMTRLSQP